MLIFAGHENDVIQSIAQTNNAVCWSTVMQLFGRKMKFFKIEWWGLDLLADFLSASLLTDCFVSVMQPCSSSHKCWSIGGGADMSLMKQAFTKLRHHLHPVLHWIVVVVDRERTVQCQSFIWMQQPNAYKYRVGLLWLQRQFLSDNVINSSLGAALHYGDWVEIPRSKLMVGDIVKACKSYHPCWIFWHHVQWSLN